MNNDIESSTKELLQAKEQLANLQETVRRGTRALKRNLMEAGMDDALTINFSILKRRLNLDGIVRRTKPNNRA